MKWFHLIIRFRLSPEWSSPLWGWLDLVWHVQMRCILLELIKILFMWRIGSQGLQHRCNEMRNFLRVCHILAKFHANSLGSQKCTMNLLDQFRASIVVKIMHMPRAGRVPGQRNCCSQVKPLHCARLPCLAAIHLLLRCCVFLSQSLASQTASINCVPEISSLWFRTVPTERALTGDNAVLWGKRREAWEKGIMWPNLFGPL